MKLMLYIGLEEGNYLEDNWVEVSIPWSRSYPWTHNPLRVFFFSPLDLQQVLMCVSQLELLQTLSAGIQAYEQSRKSRDR